MYNYPITSTAMEVVGSAKSAGEFNVFVNSSEKRRASSKACMLKKKKRMI